MKAMKKILSVILVCVMCLGIGATAALGATYIGNDKAIEAALSHAGATADQAKFITCEFDYDNGLAVYDVEFYFNKFEYSYEINAKTGAVVKVEKDWLGTNVPSGEYIGEKAAKDIAFADAGVKEADAKRVTVKFDFDDGIAKYDVEFHADGYEYDYEIEAVNGSILKVDRDREFSLSTSFFSDLIARLVEFLRSIFG